MLEVTILFCAARFGMEIRAFGECKRNFTNSSSEVWRMKLIPLESRSNDVKIYHWKLKKTIFQGVMIIALISKKFVNEREK